MIKQLLAAGCVVLSCGAALAQTPTANLASETFKQRLRQQYLSNDTAQAIINLYGRRQGGGASWITGALLASARIATSNSSTDVGNGIVIQSRPNVGATFLAALPFVAYGVGKLVHYRNGNLERTLTAYAAGQPLKRGLRRKLKPKFFAQPIIQYQPAR